MNNQLDRIHRIAPLVLAAVVGTLRVDTPKLFSSQMASLQNHSEGRVYNCEQHYY